MTSFDKTADAAAEQADWHATGAQDDATVVPSRPSHTTASRQRSPLSSTVVATSKSGARRRDDAAIAAARQRRRGRPLPPVAAVCSAHVPNVAAQAPAEAPPSSAQPSTQPVLELVDPAVATGALPANTLPPNDGWATTVPLAEAQQHDVAAAARRARAAAGGVTMASGADGEGLRDFDFTVAPGDSYLGMVIDGRYRLLETIGEGGMGRVFLARHIAIDKNVAIKVLHLDLMRDKEAVGRFVREARAVSSIGNAHIVDVSDFGRMPDGSTYFVMEYLDGPTLADRIEQQGRFTVDQVCDIALQLCEGLGAAHAKQIVHRDLKPENVTLVARQGRKDYCKIVDFGIAKVSNAADTTKLTLAGAVFGTPHYMSPEQASAGAIDHRTDIYSLGVIVYELVAGQLPFDADNFMGILTQHMYRPPAAMSSIEPDPECPRALEAIILKCLAKKPDNRYPTMAALAADLRKLQTTGESEAVEEISARSGEFAVPADYFATGAHAAASKQNVTKKRFVAWLLAALVLFAAVAVVANQRRGEVKTAVSQVAAIHINMPPAPSTQVAAAPAPIKPAQVLLYADPPSAFAVVAGDTIKLPETLGVQPGKRLKVQVKARGHVGRTIELDGSKTKVKVTLKRAVVPARKPHRPAARPTTNSDVVEPWAN